MRSYVAQFDKAELTVQRGVERCNKWIRDWLILNGPDGIFRCSPRPGFLASPQRSRVSDLQTYRN